MNAAVRPGEIAAMPSTARPSRCRRRISFRWCRPGTATSAASPDGGDSNTRTPHHVTVNASAADRTKTAPPSEGSRSAKNGSDARWAGQQPADAACRDGGVALAERDVAVGVDVRRRLRRAVEVERERQGPRRAVVVPQRDGIADARHERTRRSGSRRSCRRPVGVKRRPVPCRSKVLGGAIRSPSSWMTAISPTSSMARGSPTAVALVRPREAS